MVRISSKRDFFEKKSALPQCSAVCTTRARCHGALQLRRSHKPAARAKKAIDEREFARTEDGAGNTAFSQVATGRAEEARARARAAVAAP